MYIDDLIRAIYICCENILDFNIRHDIINIASSESLQLKEYIYIIYQLLNSKSRLLFGSFKEAKGSVVSTCPDVSKLKNKSVFITGATGLFGLWLLEFLLFLNKKYDFNVTITILTRSYYNFISKYPKFKDCNIDYIENDIVNFKLNKRYDFFFDLVDAKNKNFEESYDIKIAGIKNVINICENIEVEKLLFISSGSVYGKQPSNILKITEDIKGIPINDYAKAKNIPKNFY